MVNFGKTFKRGLVPDVVVRGQPSRKTKRRSISLVVGCAPSCVCNCCLLFYVGGNLLSHNLPVAVPSARAGLASGFGMGPGVSLSLLTTDKLSGQQNFCVLVFRCCVRYCIVDANTCVCFFLFVHGRFVCVCFGLLVPVDSTPCGASMSGLSTP